MRTKQRVLPAAAFLASTVLLTGCGAVSSLVGGDSTAEPTASASSEPSTPSESPTASESASPTEDSTESGDDQGAGLLLTKDELGTGEDLVVSKREVGNYGPAGEFTMSYSVDGVDLPKECADAVQELNDASSQANRLELIQYTGDFGDAAIDRSTGDEPNVILYHVTSDEEGSVFGPVGKVQQACSTASGQGGAVSMTTVPVGSYPNSFFTELGGGGLKLTIAAVGLDHGTEHVYMLAMNLTPEAVQTIADNQQAKMKQKLG